MDELRRKPPSWTVANGVHKAVVRGIECSVTVDGDWYEVTVDGVVQAHRCKALLAATHLAANRARQLGEKRTRT